MRTLGFAHREGHQLAFLRWLDLAEELDVAHPGSVRAAGSRRSSSCPTWTRCLPYWSVSLRSRVSCCRHYHFCAASSFFFMQAVIGVDPEIVTLECNLTTSSHTSLAGLLPLVLSTTQQTRRNYSMFIRAGKWFLSRRVEFSAWEIWRFL